MYALPNKFTILSYCSFYLIESAHVIEIGHGGVFEDGIYATHGMVYIVYILCCFYTTNPKLKKYYIFYSFKERGVLNTLIQLNVDQKRSGVISASIGNYGIALSCIATKLGIPCIVVMPMNAPSSKISKAQGYGAKVMLHGANMQDAITQALLLRNDKKMLYISG